MTTQKERWAARAEKRLAWAESAERQAAALERGREAYNGDIAFWTQPGRIPERSRLHERDRRAAELRQKAKAHRDKAKELQRLATRNLGDAERAKQAIRDASSFQVGDRVISTFFGPVEVVKVNAKTYRIRLAHGGTITQDKIFFRGRAA